jgi:hypothetical protein
MKIITLAIFLSFLGLMGCLIILVGQWMGWL